MVRHTLLTGKGWGDSDWTRPEQAARQSQPTDFLAEFNLELRSPDQLLLRTRLADEKGVIEYTQRFRRRP